MRAGISKFPMSMPIAVDNLKRAYQHGVTLVTGSDAGNLLVIHGPTVQHEMVLWVQAGIPPALPSRPLLTMPLACCGADDHVGTVRVGNDADLLVVDGNPLEDISVTNASHGSSSKRTRLRPRRPLHQE